MIRQGFLAVLCSTFPLDLISRVISIHQTQYDKWRSFYSARPTLAFPVDLPRYKVLRAVKPERRQYLLNFFFDKAQTVAANTKRYRTSDGIQVLHTPAYICHFSRARLHKMYLVQCKADQQLPIGRTFFYSYFNTFYSSSLQAVAAQANLLIDKGVHNFEAIESMVLKLAKLEPEFQTFYPQALSQLKALKHYIQHGKLLEEITQPDIDNIFRRAFCLSGKDPAESKPKRGTVAKSKPQPIRKSSSRPSSRGASKSVAAEPVAPQSPAAAVEPVHQHDLKDQSAAVPSGLSMLFDFFEKSRELLRQVLTRKHPSVDQTIPLVKVPKNSVDSTKRKKSKSSPSESDSKPFYYIPRAAQKRTIEYFAGISITVFSQFSTKEDISLYTRALPLIEDSAVRADVALYTTYAEELAKYEDTMIEFVAHVIRAKHQDEALRIRLDDIAESEIIVIADHKMKLITKEAKESTRNFFGKGGLSMLGVLILMRKTDKRAKIIANFKNLLPVGFTVSEAGLKYAY